MVAIDDVVVATAFDQVVAAATEEDVALGPDIARLEAERSSVVADTWALLHDRCADDGAERRREARDQPVEPSDPGDTDRIERVASGEPANSDGRRDVVTAQDVVEVGSRVGFDLLPAVAVDDYLDRDPAQLLVDHHVVVRTDAVVLVERPVEAG